MQNSANSVLSHGISCDERTSLRILRIQIFRLQNGGVNRETFLAANAELLGASHTPPTRVEHQPGHDSIRWQAAAFGGDDLE